MTKKELENALDKAIGFNQELMKTISDQQLEIVNLKMDMEDWWDMLEECKEPGDLDNFCINLRNYLKHKLKKTLTKQI